MPRSVPKKLYMAHNIEELNKKIKEIPENIAKRLVKSAQKVLENAENADQSKDEELAYVYYMTYFAIVQKVQKQDDYNKEKKYYDSLLKPKTVTKAIDQAEALMKSLKSRYDSQNSKPSTNGQPLANGQSSENITRKNLDNDSTDSMKQPVITYSTQKQDLSTNDKFMHCRKLYSLILQRSSSYLIVDIRKRKEFEISSMKLSNVINIPEESLNPGLTAERAGRDLDETSRLLWHRRNTYDYLIICDWSTDDTPFPKPLLIIVDAIEKWDPGKNYQSKPLILQGGFDLFRLMYPMLVLNPRSEMSLSDLYNRSSLSSLNETISLNFEYPDLDTAFIKTPSPRISDQYFKDDSLLEVDRKSKPAVPSDSFNSQSNTKPLNSFTLNTTDAVNGIDSDFTLKTDSTTDFSLSTTKEVVPTIPVIPSRSLKPKELLNSMEASQAIKDEESILEESYQIEQETLNKLKEMEVTKKKKENAHEINDKNKFAALEARIKDEISILHTKSKDSETKYSAMKKQNEELWNIIQTLTDKIKLDDNTKEKLSEASPKVDPEKNLKLKEMKRKNLQEEVEKLRKERKEKEKQLKEEHKNEITKIKKDFPTESSSSNERKNIPSERPSRDKILPKGKGDTYITKLKTSPRTSPIRGGSKIKRSHSALNLSQLHDSDIESSSVRPAFDRSLKPLESPKRRNVNAARQRNFEPKYGNVGPARTGLKNLGNTCYMNSIIQCLNNTKPLAKYFFQGHYDEDLNYSSSQHGEIAEEIGAVIRALWCGQYRSIAMWDLKTTVGRFHRPFLGSDQQDSHEFLIMLMDWLHDDLNLVRVKHPQMKEQNFDSTTPDYVAAEQVLEELQKRDDSIIRTLFHGLHKSVIICEDCGHRSLTFEPFSVLTLSIPTNGRCSLKDLIYDFYKESKIDYTCPRCKRMRSCTRKMDIWKLPSILVIQLNRFEHDVLMKKKQNYIDFPIENLDLGHYTYKNRNCIFNLYGVSNHYGTIDGGHYTAYCRSPNSRSWFKFDDHEVYELPKDSVKSSAAYLLFYEAPHDHLSNL